MKIELLVNLKVADGSIVSAGTIFSDEAGPIPEFVYRRLRRGAAKVISTKASPSKVSANIEDTKEESLVEEVVSSPKETVEDVPINETVKKEKKSKKKIVVKK